MVFAEFQEWSEEESEEDDNQQPISREDSGIQLDRTPQEDQDNSNKMIPVTWTGVNWSQKKSRENYFPETLMIVVFVHLSSF